ncbi:MAG: carbon storage regulator CsrA [Candidatus Magnetobacterium sp. LHC-1]|uniref:Translational regulator CsrA n=1 Tax=Candidatus Magnetobacterium casense TaxID=1455061 RepID=A0ABS6RV79_9BACT|nr:carbon storage regulator CsrA [Candidatus Magnetobacterium casensis]MBF0606440.1 carbon storage regulator CsrA [Nitrospirota bacterium]MBV6340528.1 carbon storage regulator CsrA [Candidatus Magnetobacterium casensis]
MLVLTRKSEEAIKLGDLITITIVEIKGNKVRLGIDAPSGVRIYRKELYERIKAENLLSAGLTKNDFDEIKNAIL